MDADNQSMLKKKSSIKETSESMGNNQTRSGTSAAASNRRGGGEEKRRQTEARDLSLVCHSYGVSYGRERLCRQRADDFDIVYPQIIISTREFAQCHKRLRQNNITHILNAAESNSVIGETGTNEEYYQDNIILVHCIQGYSRSATLVAAYLMIKKGFTAEDALRQIRKNRVVHPNQGFLKLLARLDRRLSGGTDGQPLSARALLSSAPSHPNIHNTMGQEQDKKSDDHPSTSSKNYRRREKRASSFSSTSPSYHNNHQMYFGSSLKDIIPPADSIT